MEPDELPTVEDLLAWFHARYEDPVECMPWVDGEYFWLTDAYDARDVLDENFPNLPEDLLEEVLKELYEHSYEWASKADLDKLSE